MGVSRTVGVLGLVVGVFFCAACESSKESDPTGTVNGLKERSSAQFQLITGVERGSAKERWDRYFRQPGYVHGKEPIPFLKQNIGQIPKGNALVLAMGEGKDAVYLARQGFRVEGVDISEVALRKARALAREHRVSILPVAGNLRDYRIKEDFYDLIVMVTYFRGSIVPRIKRGLREGGVAVLQQYTRDHLKKPRGLTVPERFLVQKGELKKHFSDFEIIEYQERNTDDEAVASLIAKKAL